jgi:hypothetical protein
MHSLLRYFSIIYLAFLSLRLGEAEIVEINTDKEDFRTVMGARRFESEIVKINGVENLSAFTRSFERIVLSPTGYESCVKLATSENPVAIAYGLLGVWHLDYDSYQNVAKKSNLNQDVKCLFVDREMTLSLTEFLNSFSDIYKRKFFGIITRWSLSCADAKVQTRTYAEDYKIVYSAASFESKQVGEISRTTRSFKKLMLSTQAEKYCLGLTQSDSSASVCYGLLGLRYLKSGRFQEKLKEVDESKSVTLVRDDLTFNPKLKEFAGSFEKDAKIWAELLGLRPPVLP